MVKHIRAKERVKLNKQIVLDRHNIDIEPSLHNGWNQNKHPTKARVALSICCTFCSTGFKCRLDRFYVWSHKSVNGMVSRTSRRHYSLFHVEIQKDLRGLYSKKLLYLCVVWTDGLKWLNKATRSYTCPCLSIQSFKKRGHVDAI